MIKMTLKLPAIAVLSFILSAYSFPEKAGKGATIPNVPSDGAELDITPPGFTWWRAGAEDQLTYRISVCDSRGTEVLSAETGNDCRWKPSEILPAGNYSWTVDAFDVAGNKVCSRKPSKFTILEGARQIPFPDIEAALAKVPAKHPRMLFTPETIKYINTYDNQYEVELTNLDRLVAAAKKNDVPKLTFHTYDGSTKEGWAKLRDAYKNEFIKYVGFYRSDVRALALKYVLSGDREAGLLAKKHLLSAIEYPTEGASPMIPLQGNLDEIALAIVECGSWIYDWTYDLFSPAERERVEDWFLGMNGKLMFRISPKLRDYLITGTDSHSGRIPAFLASWAVCLSERPEAADWLRKVASLAMTNYPYWGGADGGWAEGVSYSTGYTSFMFVAFENLRRATGINLLDMPFFRNYPYFLAWCSSPVAEVTPFGDEETFPSKRQAMSHSSAMRFVSNVSGDGELAWWADLYGGGVSTPVYGFSSIVQNLIFRSVSATRPENVPTSRVFKDVGIAAFHSNILEPEKDNMFLLKSSPYGSLSHSHSDQNSFVVLQGGKVLALPGAERYPIAESPFHQYARSSAAHNTMLFGGRGQIRGSRTKCGSISRSAATTHLSYAVGSAAAAYEGVRRFDRHALMVHPSVIVLLDQYELEKPEKAEWLFHAKEKPALRPGGFLSLNGKCQMDVRLFASGPLYQTITDDWPVNPKKGYEFVETKDPAKQWHLKFALAPSTQGHILAVMLLDPAVKMNCAPGKDDSCFELSFRFPDGAKATVSIDADAVEKPVSATYSVKKRPTEVI